MKNVKTKSAGLLGVSKAKITKQGCKISQTDANGTRTKMGGLVGWLVGERATGEREHEDNPIM